MPLFRRQSASQHTPSPAEAVAVPPPPAEPEGPRTLTSAERARKMLQDAQLQQSMFVAEAATRGLSREEIAAAAADAINSGVLPRIFRGEMTFRNTTRPLPVVLLHGPVTAEALWVSLGEGPVPPSLSTVSLRDLPNRDSFPDGPAEGDFYAEQRYILHSSTPRTAVRDFAATVALMETMQATEPPVQGHPDL